MGDFIGLISELFKKSGGMGGGGASQPGAGMAQAMPMAQAPDQTQGMQQNQMSDADKKFMQQQQMAKNGQQNMQQMMQNGMSGNVNPGYKDMSQFGNMESLMGMLMGMGGRNGR